MTRAASRGACCGLREAAARSEEGPAWLDECNCLRCSGCSSTVPLGYAACPHCGGDLKPQTVDLPPAPRDKALEPDNGFQCFGCGLVWREADSRECPFCSGMLLPVRVDERLLG